MRPQLLIQVLYGLALTSFGRNTILLIKKKKIGSSWIKVEKIERKKYSKKIEYYRGEKYNITLRKKITNKKQNNNNKIIQESKKTIIYKKS